MDELINPANPTSILTSQLWVKPEFLDEFAAWQAEFNRTIAGFPGFISLEIISPVSMQQPEWLVIQRFHTAEEAANWCQSETRQALMRQLKSECIQEVYSNPNQMQGGVTEVFVTQVSRENEAIYRQWIGKIHQAEAKFPGFKGVYMQSPNQSGGINWITMLRFDTVENLDRWLHSSERQEILNEAKSLITSLESHRMMSPYAGWFSSLTKEGKPPSVWKQTMLVLLVLFPIVMLELKYLSTFTASLNISLATFIGNAISVTLIAWPMMPIVIWFLGWWLKPASSSSLQINLLGILFVLFLYLVEIIIFWSFI